jgi:hypothetical protein
MSKLLEKKGQAALEFLTTYGWAFMVILVMIGALAYFGILNPQNLVRDQCMSTAGIDCVAGSVEAGATSGEGYINLTFTNNIGKQLQSISGLQVKQGSVAFTLDTANCEYTHSVGGGDISSAAPLNTEGVASVVCPIDSGLTKVRGDKIKLTFTFDYQALGTGELPHLASGSITTTVR